MQNKDSKEEVNGVTEHSTAARVGLSNKVKINNSLDRPKGSNTHRDQYNQDGDKKPKVETKRREFKFRKNHELLNHKEKEIMQDFIDKSPEKIHPSQLCPEVKLETLSPELKLMAEKSHTITETASQPTTRLDHITLKKKVGWRFYRNLSLEEEGNEHEIKAVIEKKKIRRPRICGESFGTDWMKILDQKWRHTGEKNLFWVCMRSSLMWK